MKRIKNHQWYAMLGLLLGCLFAPRPAHAQFVLYIYDPTRHVITLANSTSTEKKFNEATQDDPGRANNSRWLFAPLKAGVTFVYLIK